MEFHTFGDKGKKPLLIMHGMLCDWRKFYEKLKLLQEEYYLIFPAMSGFYDGAGDFVSFAEECGSLETFIRDCFDGHLYAVLGFSQGATLMSELLARDHVMIDKAILDGVYVARQGKLCAALGVRAFSKMQKNGGKPSKALVKVMTLMGLDEGDMAELSMLYRNFSLESLKANLYENYTYRANPEIAHSKTEVYLWCGSKEPYAKKSHRIMKKYLQNYEEHIFDGYGHGQFMYRETDEYIREVKKVLA